MERGLRERGLVEGARPFKLAEVEERCELVAAPFGRASARRRLVVGIAAAVVLAGLGLGSYEAWQWYEREQRRAARAERRMVEEVIKEGVDVVAFLDGCVARRAGAPALPPMWEEVSYACWAQAGELKEVDGKLEEGAMLARWRMARGANAAMARRLAESRLDQWDVGAVLIGSAWGAMEVGTPVRRWEGEQPSTVAWRDAVDRAIGTLGRVSYRQARKRGFRAELRTAYPVSVMRERLAGIAWLELVSVVRKGDTWEYEFSRVEPRVVLREATAEEFMGGEAA